MPRRRSSARPASARDRPSRRARRRSGSRAACRGSRRTAPAKPSMPSTWKRFAAPSRLRRPRHAGAARSPRLSARRRSRSAAARARPAASRASAACPRRSGAGSDRVAVELDAQRVGLADGIDVEDAAAPPERADRLDLGQALVAEEHETSASSACGSTSEPTCRCSTARPSRSGRGSFCSTPRTSRPRRRLARREARACPGVRRRSPGAATTSRTAGCPARGTPSWRRARGTTRGVARRLERLAVGTTYSTVRPVRRWSHEARNARKAPSGHRTATRGRRPAASARSQPSRSVPSRSCSSGARSARSARRAASSFSREDLGRTHRDLRLLQTRKAATDDSGRCAADDRPRSAGGAARYQRPRGRHNSRSQCVLKRGARGPIPEAHRDAPPPGSTTLTDPSVEQSPLMSEPLRAQDPQDAEPADSDGFDASAPPASPPSGRGHFRPRTSCSPRSPAPSSPRSWTTSRSKSCASARSKPPSRERRRRGHAARGGGGPTREAGFAQAPQLRPCAR